MGFGKQLEMVLEEKALSVAELARITKISPSTIYSIIDRDTDSVGLDKVRKIEKAVGATPGNAIYNLLHNIDNSSQNQYYLSDETAKVAQEIFENKELKMLFDVTKDANPEDLRALHSLALALKRKERGNSDDI